ncbi:hypothetical protein C0J52_25050 [Blattella germanica]|nr:hypothetical protein C0J52_25050 [Blattella germanica]
MIIRTTGFSIASNKDISTGSSACKSLFLLLILKLLLISTPNLDRQFLLNYTGQQ